jgi:uncharacterized protein (DUF302 family)
MRRTLAIGYDEALARVPEALQSEGFGILTEIDVRETLSKKLGVGFRKYKILGACNPPLAHDALQRELGVGVMMPCNVVVYEGDDGNAVVEAVDPVRAIAGSGATALEPFAVQVREKLERALGRIA